MSSRNLSCPACRIRMRADGPDVDIRLLEGNCPICAARLTEVSSAASVVGFRLFDLSALADQDVGDPPPTSGEPITALLDARLRSGEMTWIRNAGRMTAAASTRARWRTG